MLAARIPVADMAAANASLEAQGFGAANFTVPVYEGEIAAHAVTHTWSHPALEAAIKALPGVTWSEAAGSPADRVAAVLPEGAQWAGNIEPMEDAP